MRKLVAPQVDPRTEEQVLQQVLALAPNYVPEWLAKEGEDDPAHALARIFARMANKALGRLNAAPRMHMANFLRTLGIQALLATPARTFVQFAPVEGLAGRIVVPRQTQVSATVEGAPDGTLPFETTRELQLVAGGVKRLVGVDPQADAIYLPPPGFLERITSPATARERELATFAGAGAPVLQLDDGSELEPGAYLRVEAEPTIVAKPEEDVITLDRPLAASHAAGARAQEILDFHLMESVNHQAHELYLSHAEYFKLESTATIKLNVDLARGASSALTSEWSFWGKAPGASGEAWHSLSVLRDETGGFVRSGLIQLRKPTGEVVTREVAGHEGFWLRCAVAELKPSVRLPNVDGIDVDVETSQAPIVPNPAFHNVNPLTLPELPPAPETSFFPYGQIPRTGDSFYVASNEAFSKPGAYVTVKTRRIGSENISSVTALAESAAPHAFAVGLLGRIVELKRPGGATGGGLSVSVLPSQVARALDGQVIGATLLDGKVIVVAFLGRLQGAKPGLLMHVFADGEWQGTPEVAPTLDEGTEKAAGVASIRESKSVRIFVVSDQKRLWHIRVNSKGAVEQDWDTVGNRDDPPLRFADPASVPFVMRIGTHTVAIVRTDDGEIVSLDLDERQPTDLGNLNFPTPSGSPPFALQERASGEVHVYVAGDDGNLHRWRGTRASDGTLTTVERWTSLGRPAGVLTRLDPAARPFAIEIRNDRDGDGNYSTQLGHKRPHVFVRMVNGGIAVYDAADSGWEAYPGPSAMELAGYPAVVAHRDGETLAHDDERSVVSLFSGTGSTAFQQLRLAFRSYRAPVAFGPDQVASLTGIHNGRQLVEFQPFGQPNDSCIRLVRWWASEGLVAARDWPTPIVANTACRHWVDPTPSTSRTITPSGGTAASLSPALDGTDFATGERVWISIRRKLWFVELTSLSTVNRIFGDPLPSAQRCHVYKIPTAQSRLDPVADNNIIGFLDRDLGLTDDETKKVKSAEVIDAHVDVRVDPTQATQPRQMKEYHRDSGLGKVDLAWNPTDIQDKPGRLLLRTLSTVHRWREHGALPAEVRPVLSWETWDGTSWTPLNVEAVDEGGDPDPIARFLAGGSFKFRMPQQLERTEVGGKEAFWVRARLASGDYGRETYSVDVRDPSKHVVKVSGDTLLPPQLAEFSVTYTAAAVDPQRCLAANNLETLDQTAACNKEGVTFMPFLRLEDERPAVYMGFDELRPGGPYQTLFDVREEKEPSDEQTVDWQVERDGHWNDIEVEDTTRDLHQTGLVSFSVPHELPPEQRLGSGSAMHWMRGVLKGPLDEPVRKPVLRGVYGNVAAAIQARSVTEEIVGSSNGEENQVFHLVNKPVLTSADVAGVIDLDLRVREFVPEEERARLLEDAVAELRDDGVWVRWEAVQGFFSSTPEDRHYVLDAAEGTVRFGDGRRGRIPPSGTDAIRAVRYQTGGGRIGNAVEAGAIASLVSALADVEQVSNPLPAGGGSDTADLDQMLRIGPQRLRHRDRAVSSGDYEALAMAASRRVARARCLDSGAGSGEVRVVMAPHSSDPEPVPSLELRRQVRRYLRERCPATIADAEGDARIRIEAPLYVRVNVFMRVVPKTLEDSGRALDAVKKRVREFLHPLNGGPTGCGWEFGRDVQASDIFSTLRGLDSVDYVHDLQLGFREPKPRDWLGVPANALPVAGDVIAEITVRTERGRV